MIAARFGGNRIRLTDRLARKLFIVLPSQNRQKSRYCHDMTFLERFLIYGIIGYIIYRWVKKKIAGPQPNTQIREVIRPIKGSEKMVRCSACQIYVPGDRATLHAPKKSEQFYICVDCEYAKSKTARM